MPESEFEELCRDVVSREPTVSDARLFRTRGHAQFGIDVFCPRRHGDGCEVAQCKREREFSSAKIRAASDAFFKYLEYWQDRGVKRFILIVAEPLQELSQYDQIRTETKRFADVAIHYQAWSLHTLVQKLVPWPDIVARYFGHHRAHWVETICGRTLAPYIEAPSNKRKLTGGAAEGRFAELIALAAAGITSKLEESRSLARRGLVREAREQLATLQSESTFWDQLPPELRGKALRLRASLALDRPDGIAEAKRLVAEADATDRTPSLGLQAQIVLEEQGPEATLDFLGSADESGGDIVRIRAVCHLRAGQPEAAMECLKSLSGNDADPETRRLLAIALMACSRQQEAVEQIRLVAVREPEGWAMRMTLGMILYQSALSPVAVRGRIAAWPEPCDWTVVRRDDLAVANLREAANIFSALQTNGQERVQREALQTWQLACLANDAERRAEAEDYCQHILRADPTHAPAVLWSLARAFPTEGKTRVLDIQRTQRALEDLLDSGKGNLTHLTTLAALLIWRDKPSKAERLLKRHEQLFLESSTGGDYRKMLLVEATLRKGGKPSPEELRSLDTNRVAMLTALREADEETARLKLIDLARRCHEAGANDPVFPDALFYLAYTQHLKDVAPFADALLASVGTADAVRLAAHAKAATEDYTGALAVLNAHTQTFPGGTLPRDLRLLRVQCHEHLGNLSAAIAEMEELNESPTGIQEVVGMADLYFRRGDLLLASKTVSGLAKDPRLSAGHALRFARLLSNDDPALARTLWDRAVAAELDTRWLPTAFEVARKLAVGPESALIIKRMTADAVPMGGDTADAPVVSLSTEQMVEFFRERHHEMERFSDLYAKGAIPLHILAPQMGLSFAKLYHADLTLRERGDNPQGFLPAVHGSRAMPDQFPPDQAPWRLHLDISAVLLAAHLGILDAVERCFRPLRISSHVVPTLLLMRNAVLDGSPDETAAARDILEAASAGRLHSVGPTSMPRDPAEAGSALARLAADQNGAALFWGETARERSRASEPAINLSGLVSILEERGAITPSAAVEARTRLGAAGGESPISLHLSEGAPIFFHGNTIQSLAEAGLLAATCVAFRVHAEAAFLSRLDAAQRAWAVHVELGAWLAGLLDRLNRGIQDGTFQLLPLSPSDVERLGPRDELLICLLDLFRIPPEPGNAVWVDDRALSAYASCGAAPLLGVADILAALRTYKRIGDDEYFEKLLRLRAAGVRLLQPAKGEFGYWLRKTEIEGNQVRESQALATLRRYAALCLSEEGFLQIPPLPDSAPNPGGELVFVISWQRAISATLTELWSDPELQPARILACSRWLRNNLSVERYQRLPAYQPTDAGRRAVLANELAALLCAGFLLMRPFLADDLRCRNYMGWIDAELLDARLRSDPDVKPRILQSLKEFLFVADNREEEQALRVRQLLNARLLEMLPESLKQELLSDRALLTSLGLEQDLRVVSIGNLTIPAVPYLRAVRRALSEASEEVTDSGGRRLALTAAVTKEGVRVTVASGAIHVTVTDALNILLQDDEALARGALLRDSSWIDEPEPSVSARVEALLAMPDHAERVMAALDLRDQSAVTYYARLEQRVADGHRVSIADFEPPSLVSLLAYLRLGPRGPTVGQRLAQAAEALVEQLGLDKAFHRLSGLPSLLPPSLLSAFDRLDAAAQRAMLEGWGAAHTAPVALLHLAHLANRLSGASANTALLSRIRAVRESFEGGEFDTFAALLNAIGARSAEWQGHHQSDTTERLAACWCHAGRVYQGLRGATREISELRAFAVENSGDGMGAAFSADLDYRTDVACPQNVTGLEVLIWGLRYAVGDSPSAAVLAEIRPWLAPLVTQEVSGTRLPVDWLLQDHGPKRDAIISFLAGDIGGFAECVANAKVAWWYSRTWQREMVAKALGVLTFEGKNYTEWRIVLAVVGYAAVYADLRELLRQAIAESWPDGDLADDPGLPLIVLRFACLQAALTSDNGLRVTVEAFFQRIAPALLRRTLFSGDSDRKLETVLRAAVDLSRTQAGEPDLALFVASMSTLVVAVPELAMPLRHFLTQACYQLPFRQAEMLWPLVLRLRAQ